MRETNEVKPSMEGIQLCLANSQRLLEDSRRASRPTRAALLVLAIEEVAKGWMLFFAMAATAKQAAGDSKLSLTSSAMFASLKSEAPLDLQESVERSLPALVTSLMSPPLDEAFLNHRVKLSYVGALVKALVVIAPAMQHVPPPASVISEAFGGRVQPLDRIPSEGLSKVAGLIARLEKIDWASLEKTKEDGFYVDVEPDGSVTTPSSRLFAVDDLDTLATYLAMALGPMSRALLGK